MTDLELSPLKNPLVSELLAMLDTVRHKHGMGQSLLDGIDEALQFFEERCRRLGIVLPKLVPVVLQKNNLILLVRASWDADAIKTFVLNTCIQYPTVDMTELALEVKRVFPAFRPEQLMQANENSFTAQELFKFMRSR